RVVCDCPLGTILRQDGDAIATLDPRKAESARSVADTFEHFAMRNWFEHAPRLVLQRIGLVVTLHSVEKKLIQSSRCGRCSTACNLSIWGLAHGFTMRTRRTGLPRT